MSKRPPADLDIAWHALPVEQALARSGVDPAVGLDSLEVAARQAAHGPNALSQPPNRPAWRRFARQFNSPLIHILLIAAVLAVALGHGGDAAVIMAVVIINALIGTVQEGRAESSMAALRRLAALHVRVLRNGTEGLIEASGLVPGDVLLLAAGDAVAADARLIDTARLQVAEAALTGESTPVSKSVGPAPPESGLADRHNMVYAATHVSAGRARAVVIGTGRHTEVGLIASLTESATEPRTPLAMRLDQFGRGLVMAAMALFALVVLLGLWRDLPLPEVLMVAISQMVSMVPEGLPVAMTIAMAVGMQRMAERGAIVRTLAAVETLGATTVICSDKTGTLTRNEMTAVQLWLPDARRFDVDGVGYAPQGRLTQAGAADPVEPGADAALFDLLRAAVLCNDAELQPPASDTEGWSVLGDPTEGALLVLARKAGLDPAALRARHTRMNELPFDSDVRLMATGHSPVPDGPQVMIKGAPEAVLRLCVQDDQVLIQTARTQAEAMAGDALRVLAFAALDDGPLDATAGFEALVGRVRLLGLVGQIDPPRTEAQRAVSDCRRAGIRTVMVTGDHRLTGLAIARALGIAQAGDHAVDGLALERMGEAELRDALPDIAVFARVQPAQKLRIVEALQARGDVVAMTGDGVNDAPALARADVGVAMGITGTEVAKSAARIVVTDDNFATIVGAVEQGRVVYGNLKKVILFLFATSIDEVLVLLLALLSGYPIPLAAVQILWINLVTEGTLTVNLVMDPPGGQEMQRPPIGRDEPLLDRLTLQRTALMAGTAAAVAFGWFALRLDQGVALEVVRTDLFMLVAMSQWFNVLNCRSDSASSFSRGLLRNRWLLGGLAVSIVLQALVLYAPPLNTLFHTVPLPPESLVPLALLASATLWAEEARKWLARRRA